MYELDETIVFRFHAYAKDTEKKRMKILFSTCFVFTRWVFLLAISCQTPLQKISFKSYAKL